MWFVWIVFMAGFLGCGIYCLKTDHKVAGGWLIAAAILLGLSLVP